MKRRVLIADDEPLARQRVRRLLRTETDAVVVGEATDGPTTVEEIRRLSPDVLFLDVEMPGLDGFEVLAAAPSPPAVVFVTAFAEYAVPAFDASAGKQKPPVPMMFVSWPRSVRSYLNTRLPESGTAVFVK